MTFFAWPPDPNNDWRQLYFKNSSGTAYTTAVSGGATPVDNTDLFASNGVLNSPTGNYQINYAAILAWIRANCMQQTAGDGKPFPQQLRAANTLLYSSIPTDVPASAYTWSNANSQITSSPDPSQRFWKEYIDFVIGVWHDPNGNIQTPGNPSCSYGTDFTAGASSGGSGVSISGPDATIYINGSLALHPTVTNQGSGYLSAPTVTIGAPPSGERPPPRRPPLPAAKSRPSRLPTPAPAITRCRRLLFPAARERMPRPPPSCRRSPS